MTTEKSPSTEENCDMRLKVLGKSTKWNLDSFNKVVLFVCCEDSKVKNVDTTALFVKWQE